MSILALEASIATISGDIERQKQVLEGLERNRSLLQRQLNDLRDPIARLPLEISSEIFLLCLPLRISPAIDLAPTLFLCICHTWADVALSTPALWAALRIEFPRANDFEDVVDKWLQRARAHILRISLVGSIDKDVCAVVWRHSGRLQHLSLNYEFEEIEEMDGELHDLLGRTAPQPMPVLKTLEISGRPDMACSCLQILQLLRLSPNLVHLDLDSMSIVDRDQVVEPHVLQNLRFLNFFGDSDTESVDHALRLITAPRLEKLHVSLSEQTTFNEDLLPFLQRSAAPIQRLEIMWSDGQRLDWRLGELLEIVPAVTHLTVWDWHVEQLFSILAHSPSSLPNLREFRIPWTSRSTSESSWNVLVHAVSARRRILRTVHIAVNGGVTINASQETVASFRGLVEEGMDIRLGRPNVLDVLQ
ncbi:hypothetical protein FB45DRAFT_886212 [Roridomyces roridus]|uniref:F-box domain-containing protein n=1 Tax=Roridomyces roridus TaxID=1738132 RepID=A0AAD7CIB8_9AGAR|nr:hypothetical protein FB45DRAFT_886212 [Roridomyces roridus]